jgi:hypothetical protein
VSPVKYEQGFYIPEMAFLIVAAVKTSDLNIPAVEDRTHLKTVVNG